MSRGWALGGETFKAALARKHQAQLNKPGSKDAASREARQLLWAASLQQALSRLGKKSHDAAGDIKSAPWKVAIAAHLKNTTTVTNPWLAQKLQMGAPEGVSRYVSELREGLREDAKKFCDSSPRPAPKSFRGQRVLSESLAHFSAAFASVPFAHIESASTLKVSAHAAHSLNNITMPIHRLLRPFAVATFALTTASSAVFAQTAEAPKVTFPAASPASTVKQRVGLTDIEVTYSRPSMKGRQIFGGLEAYGKLWRTGANSATKLKFSTPVKLNGTEIPAGTYELFTIPDPTEWTVIIHKDSSQWGAYKYDEKNDVARVKAKPVKLAEPVETFTIDFNDLRNESATLNLVWETTRVPLKLQIDTTGLVLPQIEAALASPAKKSAGFYFNAAQFYHDQGLDLTKAKSFITEATAGDKPAFYMVHLKAKILAKLGEKDAAIAAAKQSSELAVAVEGPQSGFVKMNNDLIASLK